MQHTYQKATKLFKICRNYLRTGMLHAREFITTQVVRLGDILSPYLFIILKDDERHQKMQRIVCTLNHRQ